jgi:hypothetical protein
MQKNWLTLSSMLRDCYHQHMMNELEVRSELQKEAEAHHEKIIARLLLRGIISNRADVVGVPLGFAVSHEGDLLGTFATPTVWTGKQGPRFVVSVIRAIRLQLINMENLCSWLERHKLDIPKEGDEYFPPLESDGPKVLTEWKPCGEGECERYMKPRDERYPCGPSHCAYVVWCQELQDYKETTGNT